MSGRYRGGGGGGEGDYYGRGGPPPPPDRRGGGGGGGQHYDPRAQRGGPPPRYRGGPPPSSQRYDNYRGGGGGGGGGNYRGHPRNNHPHPSRSCPPAPRRTKPGPITFRNFEEERAWVEDRRRKRKERPVKFDSVGNGTGALFNNTGGSSSFVSSSGLPSEQPQQTRHARRLYVGNLPPSVTEDQIHSAFANAIRDTIEDGEAAASFQPQEDPILTVYINFERGFSFVEFKSVEICSACMALDGLEIVPGYPVKVKRPNDYNPASAPMAGNSGVVPILNVSKLGIIAPTVLDSPHKIFIGGLQYHFTEAQVLELLSAFGKIKAFHLVKNDPDSALSKGYCFVEYLDSAVTPVAVAGLNGMDMGEGKQLTARVAGERDTTATTSSSTSMAPADAATAPPAGRTIVSGYDIELLVDAALGHRNMPHGPTYIDPSTGMPITRIVGGPAPVGAAALPPPSGTPLTNDSLRSVLASVSQHQAPPPQNPTRILVLLNMVTDEDLQTAEDHETLLEEVRGECAKYGSLLRVVIPRTAAPPAQASAVRKVFLEYADIPTARLACGELDGRQFGDARVQTEYLPEGDFAAGLLR